MRPAGPNTPAAARARGHRHAEAFCLMAYRADDGSAMMIIWNSRDGVTPFTLTLPGTDKRATHVDWDRDTYAPDHVPDVGEWIFVDLTAERARAHAETRTDAALASEFAGQLVEHYGGRDAMIEQLFADFYRDGAPDFVQVDEVMHEHFRARAELAAEPTDGP